MLLRAPYNLALKTSRDAEGMGLLDNLLKDLRKLLFVST